MKIKTRKLLDQALVRYNILRTKQTILTQKISELNETILEIYNKNNLTTFKNSEGTVWRYKQGSSTVYDDKAFRKLLKKKGIKLETIYQTRTIVERNDEMIM